MSDLATNPPMRSLLVGLWAAGTNAEAAGHSEEVDIKFGFERIELIEQIEARQAAETAQAERRGAEAQRSADLLLALGKSLTPSGRAELGYDRAKAWDDAVAAIAESIRSAPLATPTPDHAPATARRAPDEILHFRVQQAVINLENRADVGLPAQHRHLVDAIRVLQDVDRWMAAPAPAADALDEAYCAERGQRIAVMIKEYREKAGVPNGATIHIQDSGGDRIAVWHTDPAPAADVRAACRDCGLPYTDPGWVDAIVPHDAWANINNGPDGLLCITCMTRRARARLMTSVPVMLADDAGIWISIQDVTPWCSRLIERGGGE